MAAPAIHMLMAAGGGGAAAASWDYDWDFSISANVTTSGGNFATITDAIGGVVATKVSGNNFAYPTGTQNGLNYQSWGVSGIAFGDGKVTTTSFSLPQPFTVQWVTRQIGGNLGLAFASASGASAPEAFALPSAPNEDYRMKTSSTLDTGNYSLNTWQVVTFEFDGGSSKIYVGNTLGVSGALGNTTGITGGIVMFNNQAGSANLQLSDHGQIRMRAGIMTSTERDAAIDELQAKWSTA